MAAAFAKTHRHIHSMWKRSTKQPHPFSDFLPNQLHQRKGYSRYSIYRRVKKMDLSVPTLMSASHFSSRAYSSSSSPPHKLVGWYLGLIHTRPILTKSLTSALIYAAADLSSQTIVGEPSEGYDLIRTLRTAGYGMVILGPSLHFWYNFVSKTFPRRDLYSTVKKIVLGQTIFGPAMTTIFYSFNAASQGETGSEIVARLKRDLLPTMINGIMYWPFCDFVVFRFIPVHLQPLVTNSFSYLWTVYMTYMASLAKVSVS